MFFFNIAWSTLPRMEAADTIFSQLDADSVEFDESELLRLFARAKAGAKNKNKDKSNQDDGVARISLLGLRRANNICTMMFNRPLFKTCSFDVCCSFRSDRVVAI